MDAPPTPAPPRRRSRGLKLLALAVVLLAVLVWFAPTIVAKTSLKDSLLRSATAKLKGTVRVGGLSAGWLSPVELTDVTVTDAAGREVLTAPSVRLSKSLLALARNRADLGTITVTKPTLTVVSADRTNVEELLDEFLKGEPTGGPRPALTLAIDDGRVLLADRANPPAVLVEQATVSVQVPPDPAGLVRVKAVAQSPGAAGGGNFFLDASVGDESTVEVRALALPLDGFGPFLGRFVPGTRVGGRLTGDLTATAGATSSLSGQAEVAGLDVQSPTLGPDRVQLALARVHLKSIKLVGDTISVGPGTELDCDVGKFAASGEFSPAETPEQMLSRHGLSATADIDVARLAKVAPRLLRIRPGTELTAGRVKAEVASAPSARGVGWKGTVTTTALRGTRDGQPLGWDQPFRAVFDAHLRPNGLPEFDDLQCQSDFVGLHARGTVNEFVVRANLDLDKLAAHLGQFVDFGGATVAGTGSLAVDLVPQDGGKSKLSTAVQLLRFQFRDAAGRGLSEPALSVTAQAVGRFAPTGPVPVDSLAADVTAAGDRLTVNLVEPVADLRAARGGSVAVKLVGDLGRWAGRAAPFVGLPSGLEIGGVATAAGTFAVAADGVRCPKLVADVEPFRFRGFGLNIDETRSVHAEAGLTLNRPTGAVGLSDVRLDSDTARVFARRIDLSPLPDGGLGVKGAASLTADVARARRAVNLPVELAGLAKVDRADFDLGAGGVLRFDADGVGESLVLGPPGRPAWTEGRVKLTAAGAWGPKADAVRFDTLRAERDGLTAEAKGGVTRMSLPSAAVDVSGSLAYDLAKLEPQLRTYLGKDARAVGKERRPFKLTGPLGDGGRNVAVAVGPAAGPFDRLAGSAGLGWQELFAYGFDVGRADLRADLADGTVRFTPVKAMFGGGTVELTPTVRLDPDYTLSLAPGHVVSNATLTPAACANAVGFVLPPLANAAEVTGLVSLDLGENRIPLADPNRMAVNGTLIVHKATVSPGPLFREITAAMETPPTPLTLTQEQAVPFRVENGRVYHKQFKVMVEKTEVRTSGSVGLDGTVSILVEMQVPPKLAQGLFPNNPIARESLAKQYLRFPVGGTLSKPRLEPGAVRAALRGVAGEAARDGFGEFLRRGSDRLLQELDKKANPPEKK
jgi:translocation and assembly module TamB